MRIKSASADKHILSIDNDKRSGKLDFNSTYYEVHFQVEFAQTGIVIVDFAAL